MGTFCGEHSEKEYQFVIFWAHCLGYVSQSFVQASVPSWPGSAPGEGGRGEDVWN